MRYKYKGLALLLSLTMLSSLTATALATETEETQQPVAYGYIGDDAPAPVSQRVMQDYDDPENVRDSSLPAAFDLRNVDGKNYMTAVRNQNPYGSCWAHAVVASIESNLLMKGYTGYEDLSEMQLIYYTYERNEAVAKAGGGTEGDIVNYQPIVSGYTLMDAGGNAFSAATALAGRLGLIPESELEYNKTNADLVNAEGIGNEYARSKNVVTLDDVVEVNTKGNPEAVKKLLMTNGAASISYYDADSYRDTTNKYNYYNNVNTSTNHAVTLCGWDDNYAASNFSGSASGTPTSDGAWLCKNSWGSSHYLTDEGYFWISYEDTSLSNSFFFSGIPVEEDCDNLYQYDGGYGHGWTFYSTNSIYGANIFTAEGNESLKAVRLQIENADAEVTVSVYTGVTAGNPTSGTKQTSQTYSLDFAGIYTLALDTPVELAEGELFSVVMKIEVASTEAAKLVYDYFYDSSYARYSAAVISEGQSFRSSNGSTWNDMATSGLRNIRLKALTDDLVKTPTVSIPGDVNGDQAVTIADAALIMRHVQGLSSLSDSQLAQADVDGKNGITAADAEWIASQAVGLHPNTST